VLWRCGYGGLVEAVESLLEGSLKVGEVQVQVGLRAISQLVLLDIAEPVEKGRIIFLFPPYLGLLPCHLICSLWFSSSD
jgi:hypothetical protein